MSNVERSVAYDIVADQPFKPLSLEHDLDMLQLATAQRPPDFTVTEQWTEHMNALVAGSSFRFPNNYYSDDPKIISALQMREQVLSEFGWLCEGSPLRQSFLERRATNYPNWQRSDYIIQNLRLFYAAAKGNMMTIVAQNSEFVFRRPAIVAQRLIRSWEVGFDTEKIVEASPYFLFKGNLDDFEQNVRRRVKAYGQRVVTLAAAREIEEKQAERVPRVELRPELHQEMLAAAMVHKNNPHFDMGSEWFDKLNALIRKGSQAVPNYLGKFQDDELDTYRKEINEVRSAFLKELGLLEQDSALEKLQYELKTRKSLPVPLKVIELLQLFHGLLGKEALRPIREYPRLVWSNAGIIRAKLDTIGEVTNPAAYLLEYPRDIDNLEGDKLRERVKERLAIARKRQARLKHHAERQLRRQALDQPFPDPNATPKVFPDGLELSQAEMSFLAPGPLSLERDAGWLAVAVATAGKDMSIDQAFIDYLNKLREEDSAYYDVTKHEGVQRVRPEFLKVFGWLDVESPIGAVFAKTVNTQQGLPAIEKVVSCLRTIYAYTGNKVIDPICQSPRLLFRPVGTLGKELAEVARRGIDPAEAILRRPAFFARTTKKDFSNFSLPREKKIQKPRPEPEPETPFPDPNATPKVFPDGLELSQAEMSFLAPGPLSLERDAGWLALATVLRDVAVDQNYINKLNAIRQKAFLHGKKKAAWQEFFQEVGWEELSSNKRMLSLLTVIQNMRLMFAHLGNMVMAPITKNMVRVLERTPSTFADELGAIADPDVVEEVLTNRTNLLAGNLLKLLEKNHGKLPEPGQPGRRRTGRSVERSTGEKTQRTSKSKPKSRPKRPAPQDSYLRRSSEDLSFSAARVINPDRDRTLDIIHQTFADAPAERQRVLRGCASLLPGGLDALIETCPELIACDKKTLQDFIELSLDPDITQVVLFRKWKQHYKALKV